MKLVFGVGINDLKKTNYEESIYKVWQRMLQRCYSESLIEKYPSYQGCSVCQDWLTFSNFKNWIETQDWEGKQLDKDLLVPGNKVYSPETCVFLNRNLNVFLTESNATRGTYPIGVSYHKSAKKFVAQCNIDGKPKHLGYFHTPEEAHKAWKTKKIELAKRYASLETDPKIAEAIVRYYVNYSV